MERRSFTIFPRSFPCPNRRRSTTRWHRKVVDLPFRRASGPGWSNPEFAAIAKALHQSAGLIFPANRRESAEAGMRRAMAAACLSDPHDLRDAVATPGETRD